MRFSAPAAERARTDWAEHIVSQKLHNNGYNCAASQVLVLSNVWDQKDAFLAALRKAYAAARTRTPYYPGSEARVAAALADHPDAERLGDNRIRLDTIPTVQTIYHVAVLALLDAEPPAPSTTTEPGPSC
ncbi:hypothetical protein [Amycolatopsis sp. GA6-003]|uniref:hypothetical protein n=1 Tax=Amycolatopsis sp. GA6-003 TaxID=2652444 RepID=UPI0039171FCB